MNIFNYILIKLYQRGRKLDIIHRYDYLRKKYNLHETFRFNGDHIHMYGNGSINVGKKSYIGELSTIQASESYNVSIGEYCAISHNVRIYTSTTIPDHNWAEQKKIKKYGNVRIEDNVWIGANVFINPGVTIGFNSVVGANSVVSKDVPANAIVGGVPAKLIRYKEINA